MRFSFRKKNISKEKGFSLMELLVVIALLIIILSVSLFNYDNFGKDVELENAVYSVALAVREAQVFGVNKALKEVETPVSSFGGDYGYGVYFNKQESESSNADYKKFLLYIDDESTNNKIFGGDACSGTGECYSQIYLTKGNYISSIKVKDSNGNITPTGFVNIYFKRPNPDATILTDGSTEYASAQITISSPGGTYSRCVKVGNAGDITISRDCN
jgi:prepilin-type N-terminal cleavage/methylation domain-containing protein